MSNEDQWLDGLLKLNIEIKELRLDTVSLNPQTMVSAVFSSVGHHSQNGGSGGQSGPHINLYRSQKVLRGIYHTKRGSILFEMIYEPNEDKGYQPMTKIYAAEMADVEDELRPLLPNPDLVKGDRLKLIASEPVQKNYAGHIVQSTSPTAHVFEKIMITLTDSTGMPVDAVTWRQIGFNPLKNIEGRKRFIKDAFGLSEEEMEDLLNEKTE